MGFKKYCWPMVCATLLCISSSAYAQFFKLAPDKTVPVVIMHPPQFGLTVKRVAFGQPEGSCASEANEVVDRMILPDFQQNGMDVIERQALNQIMSEHNFNQSMYADPTSAAQLGKILGPSALIVVTVDTCSSSRQPLYNDSRNYLNNQITRTFISKTRYSLEGSVRVINLTTGQILGSHNFQSHQDKSNQSQQGQPEFPPVDDVKDAAMQEVRNQVHAMFFPSGTGQNLVFYGDRDCGLNEVYEAFKNGDHDGAMHMMDANLEACKSGKHKDKTLARAYYDDGLLHCIAKDYHKSSALFTSAMDGKGAEDVGAASAACTQAREGAETLKAYEARLAQIQAPPPINAQAAAPATPAPPGPPAAASVSTAPQAPAGQSAGTSSVEGRLKQLDKLYKSGLITKKEYDQKRAAILNSL